MSLSDTLRFWDCRLIQRHQSCRSLVQVQYLPFGTKLCNSESQKDLILKIYKDMHGKHLADALIGMRNSCNVSEPHH